MSSVVVPADRGLEERVMAQLIVERGRIREFDPSWWFYSDAETAFAALTRQRDGGVPPVQLVVRLAGRVFGFDAGVAEVKRLRSAGANPSADVVRIIPGIADALAAVGSPSPRGHARALEHLANGSGLIRPSDAKCLRELAERRRAMSIAAELYSIAASGEPDELNAKAACLASAVQLVGAAT